MWSKAGAPVPLAFAFAIPLAPLSAGALAAASATDPRLGHAISRGGFGITSRRRELRGASTPWYRPSG